MTATILALALAVVPPQTDTQLTPAKNAETPVGEFKVRACGLLVHKDNVYRLSVHAPDGPQAITLLLQPNADKNAVSKKLANLSGLRKQVIVTGAITWLPVGGQIKSDDDWTLGIVLSDEEQILETFAPEAPQINVEAQGRLTWKESRFRLIVRPQEKPAKELTLDLWVGDSQESKELVRKLDGLKTKEVIVVSKLQWVPKGAKAESPDDYTLGIAEPIRVSQGMTEKDLRPALLRMLGADPKLFPASLKEATEDAQPIVRKELNGLIDLGSFRCDLKKREFAYSPGAYWGPGHLNGTIRGRFVLNENSEWVGTVTGRVFVRKKSPAEPIKDKDQSGNQPDKEQLTPAGAKQALLAMMRSKAGQELGWFKGDIPDEMAKMKIEEEKDGWFAWTAAFRFNPSQAIYTFVVRPKPGARASIFEYEGSFVKKDGVWSATPPKLVGTLLQSGE